MDRLFAHYGHDVIEKVLNVKDNNSGIDITR